MSSALRAFGVAATVTRSAPNDAPIQTSIIWVGATDIDSGDPSFERRESRRIISIPKADVAAVPVGTLIAAPEYEGAPVQTWCVKSHHHAEFDEWRVIVSCEGSR
jgi:hypothetical protein